LRQVPFHSLSHLEADFVGKKAWPTKIGHFTRSSRENRRFAGEADRTIWRRSGFSKGPSMRGIAFLLASIMIVAGLAVAAAEEPAAPAPIKLALFPFELEDFSAAAAYTPPDDIDREQLRLSTEEARRLIAESGRYNLVDIGAVNDEAAKAGKLHDCDGCEVKIAAGVHADQSMIGIVTRISRTDYAVTYKIRDVQSGALVDVEQTDLRAGANSAWSRGARWLIQRRLLEKPN
jgi:Protein of unknown function (DUF2380)